MSSCWHLQVAVFFESIYRRNGKVCLENHDDLRFWKQLHAVCHAILGKEDKTTRYCRFRTLPTELCKPHFGSNRNITGDNGFTPVPLVKHSQEKGLTYVGTIRKNKGEIPEKMTEKTRFQPRQLFLMITLLCVAQISHQKHMLPSFHQCIDKLIFTTMENRNVL